MGGLGCLVVAPLLWLESVANPKFSSGAPNVALGLGVLGAVLFTAGVLLRRYRPSL